MACRPRDSGARAQMLLCDKVPVHPGPGNVMRQTIVHARHQGGDERQPSPRHARQVVVLVVEANVHEEGVQRPVVRVRLLAVQEGVVLLDKVRRDRVVRVAEPHGRSQVQNAVPAQGPVEHIVHGNHERPVVELHRGRLLLQRRAPDDVHEGEEGDPERLGPPAAADQAELDGQRQVRVLALDALVHVVHKVVPLEGKGHRDQHGHVRQVQRPAVQERPAAHQVVPRVVDDDAHEALQGAANQRHARHEQERMARNAVPAPQVRHQQVVHARQQRNPEGARVRAAQLLQVLCHGVLAQVLPPLKVQLLHAALVLGKRLVRLCIAALPLPVAHHPLQLLQGLHIELFAQLLFKLPFPVNQGLSLHSSCRITIGNKHCIQCSPFCSTESSKAAPRGSK